MQPRILFVEDEPSISDPFAKALVRAGFEPVTARTGREALAIARRIDPDLVLLDLNLPDTDGWDVARELRRHGDIPIVMLTARGTEMDRIVGLELGADDYVVKPFSAGELVARIRAILRRAERAPARHVVEIADLRLDLDARIVTLRGSSIPLAAREFDLLALLMRNAGSVVRREEIMDEVWDPHWFGSTKTLDVHIAWLRKKLGDDPAHPRYITTIRGVGFRFAGPEAG